MKARIASLEQLLAKGPETALLRYSLGQAYLDVDAARAVEHLQAALTLDPSHVAAWKLLGQALAANGQTALAQDAYREGIVTAEVAGQIQAAKEMRVFLKRLLRQADP